MTQKIMGENVAYLPKHVAAFVTLTAHFVILTRLWLNGEYNDFLLNLSLASTFPFKSQKWAMS